VCLSKTAAWRPRNSLPISIISIDHDIDGHINSDQLMTK